MWTRSNWNRANWFAAQWFGAGGGASRGGVSAPSQAMELLRAVNRQSEADVLLLLGAFLHSWAFDD
jgi:hypothetical protein